MMVGGTRWPRNPFVRLFLMGLLLAGIPTVIGFLVALSALR